MARKRKVEWDRKARQITLSDSEAVRWIGKRTVGGRRGMARPSSLKKKNTLGKWKKFRDGSEIKCWRLPKTLSEAV